MVAKAGIVPSGENCEQVARTVGRLSVRPRRIGSAWSRAFVCKASMITA